MKVYRQILNPPSPGVTKLGGGGVISAYFEVVDFFYIVLLINRNLCYFWQSPKNVNFEINDFVWSQCMFWMFIFQCIFCNQLLFLSPCIFLTLVPLGGGTKSPPPPLFFFIFLEKPLLQPIMKPICKFLLDPRDEPQTLIIHKKINLVAL